MIALIRFLVMAFSKLFYARSTDSVAKSSARTRPPRHIKSAQGLHCRFIRYRSARRHFTNCLAADQPPSALSTDSHSESKTQTEYTEVALHEEHQNDAWDSGTQAIHAGERGGRPRVSDSLTTPIVQTSTYTFRNTNELIAYQEGRYGSYEYGRYGNPTTRTVEEKIKAMEGAESALISASGMNSATTLLLALVPAGGHIVTTTDCYRRTRQFIQTILPKMKITATVLDPSDLDGLHDVLEEKDVSLFFTESPTNPYLRCVDIAKISEMCRSRGALVVIDSTFATSINQKALDLGADLVIH